MNLSRGAARVADKWIRQAIPLFVMDVGTATRLPNSVIFAAKKKANNERENCYLLELRPSNLAHRKLRALWGKTMTSFDEAARIAQQGFPDIKSQNMMADVQRELPQLGRDMFDKDRANICPDCRGRKITALTPKWLYEGRTLCTCDTEN